MSKNEEQKAPIHPIGDPMDDSNEYSLPPAPPQPPAQQPAPPRPSGLLPGVAGICIYMLFTSLMFVFLALRGPGAADPHARYFILPICTMIVLGVFGLLRLKRWGWSLVLAGSLMLMLMYLFKGHVEHSRRVYVMAALNLLFFLYLARPEVRERLRN